MIISFGDQRLVGSARQCPTLAVWARWGGVPKVAPELLTWPVGVASMGWYSKKLSPRLDGAVFQKLGWCSKKLSQNPRWGGVPNIGVVFQKLSQNGVLLQKLGWCSKKLSQNGVVFQKVVPEYPRLDGVEFQKLGWCSKKLSQNPHSVYYCF